LTRAWFYCIRGLVFTVWRGFHDPSDYYEHRGRRCRRHRTGGDRSSHPLMET
jgi:hypothetical protein